MMNKISISYSILILTFIFGCGRQNSGKTQGEYEVWLKNISFIPDTLNIPVGTTVTWTNQDSVEHTITSGDTVNSKILFDSGSLGLGSSFDFKFNNSGVYHYFCKMHPKRMNGIVVVQ